MQWLLFFHTVSLNTQTFFHYFIRRYDRVFHALVLSTISIGRIYLVFHIYLITITYISRKVQELLIILTIKKNISMSLLMSMLKIVCISCFKRSVRKKTTREKWKNINDLLISKTRKDIWSCCQNSINNTAFDTQLGKIF